MGIPSGLVWDMGSLSCPSDLCGDVELVARWVWKFSGEVWAREVYLGIVRKKKDVQRRCGRGGAVARGPGWT